MKPIIKVIHITIIVAGLFLSSLAYSFSFPEFGFCPLGGPPGWFNRMTGQHDRRYHAPPPWFGQPYRYPAVVPGVWQTPVNRQPPIYFSRPPAVN